MSSLRKYVTNQQDTSGKSLFWGRHDLDGLPFRGDNPPLYKEEEFDDRVVRVVDGKNGIFDIFTNEDYETENGRSILGNDKYVEILDRIANNWYTLLYIERFFDEEKKLHYMEWVEWYLEDGAPTQPSPTSIELPIR